MDSQESCEILFNQHAPCQREIKPSLVAKKSLHWVIETQGGADLARVREALEKHSLEEGKHFRIRRNTVILAKTPHELYARSGEKIFLSIKKLHDLGSHPDWLRYDRLCAEENRASYYPYGNNLHVQSENNFVEILYPENNPPVAPGASLPPSPSVAKLHLSLDEDADVAPAWDAIAQHLVDHRVECKVDIPKQDRRPVHKGGRNKAVTLYLMRHDLQDLPKWQKLLTELESLLLANDVTPGPAIASDRPIEGSRYFHLHYGGTVYDRHTGEAMDPWNADLQGQPDPFADLKINITEAEAKRFQEQLRTKPPGTRQL